MLRWRLGQAGWVFLSFGGNLVESRASLTWPHRPREVIACASMAGRGSALLAQPRTGLDYRSETPARRP